MTLANFKIISKLILENLSRKTKNLNFDVRKISLRKCQSNSVVVGVFKILSKTSKLLFSEQ